MNKTSLIKAFRENRISRETFIREFSRTQGFDGTVSAYANNLGSFLFYRGRKAVIDHGRVNWVNAAGQLCEAGSFKEFFVKVDLEEMAIQENVRRWS